MDNNDIDNTSVDDALENSRPGTPLESPFGDPIAKTGDNPASPATDVPNVNYPQVQPTTDSLPDSDETYQEGTTAATNPLADEGETKDDTFDPNAEQTL